jgi:hypothetical protein
LKREINYSETTLPDYFSSELLKFNFYSKQLKLFLCLSE